MNLAKGLLVNNFYWNPLTARQLNSFASNLLATSNLFCGNNLTSKRYKKSPHFPKKGYQLKYDWRYLDDHPYTAEPLKLPRLGGRSVITGRKISQRIGGGVKYDFYWISTYPYIPPSGEVYEERVLEVRKDPNRTSFIALVAGRHGRRWTIATDGLVAGDILRTNNFIPEMPFVPPEREAWPIGAVAAEVPICMVEMLPDAKSMSEMRAVQAGTSIVVSGRMDDFVVVRFPDKKQALVRPNCMCTIGKVSNPEWDSMQWGSMSMKRRMGIKQGSGLKIKKDSYCGRRVHPIAPPFEMQRMPPPTLKYKVTLTDKDYNSGFGVNELNPILKGC